MDQHATIDPSTKDLAAKSAACRLLARGIITQSEAAKLAGVSRQLMRHWMKGIPAKRTRDSVIAKLWSRELAKARK